MMKKCKWGKLLLNYGVITVSCTVYALGFCWFYQPNTISFGGFTGIAQILNHFFPVLPVGTLILAMNVPLFFLAYKKQGLKLICSSAFAMTVSSLMIDALTLLVDFPKSEDMILAAVCGGVIMGMSMGVMLNFGATTGGTELLARLLKYKFCHLPIGKLCLALDTVIIVLYTIAFRNIYSGLYGLIAMYISSTSMDTVIYGIRKSRLAYIISDKADEIRAKLLEFGLGVTKISAEGGWSKEHKPLLLCAFKNQYIAYIKPAVTAIDPDAFIILCDANEILGEGFETYTDDSL